MGDELITYTPIGDNLYYLALANNHLDRLRAEGITDWNTPSTNPSRSNLRGSNKGTKRALDQDSPVVMPIKTFKATRVKASGKKLRRNWRYDQPKGANSHDLVQAMYPLVRWQMFLKAAEFTSEVGRQGWVHDDQRCIICGKDELQAIYKKLTRDISSAPQGSRVGQGSFQTVIKEYYPTVENDYLPSLQCLDYTRVYTISNTADTVSYIEFWECIPKLDCIFSFVKEWETLLQKAAVGSTNTDGQYGLLAAQSNTTVPKVDHTYAIDHPGFEPWSNMKILWQKYSCFRKTRYKLEPGTSIKHKVVIPGFTASWNTLHNPDRESLVEYLANISVSVCMKIIGQRGYENHALNDANKEYDHTYMTGRLNVGFTDYTKWRVRPRLRKSYRFLTNYVNDFNDASFDEDHFHYRAYKPVVIQPVINSAAESQHNVFTNDGIMQAGGETYYNPTDQTQILHDASADDVGAKPIP